MTEYVSLQKIMTVITVTLFGWLSWFGKKNVNKIEYLAENCVTRKEYQESLNRIESKIDKISDKLEK